MERIDRGVERQLRRLGVQGGMPAIVAAWPEAVGETIARNAWPARVARDGTLHVHTSSSTWAFELGQLAPTILERLSFALAGDAPRALRFAPGHLPEPAPEVSASNASGSRTPTPEAVARAEALTALIADEDLRERVARAAALSLSRAASGRSV